MKNLRTIFGIGVHRRRKALGLTQAQLADRIDLSVDAAKCRWVHSRRYFLRAVLVADALDVHPAELFGGFPRVPGK